MRQATRLLAALVTGVLFTLVLLPSIVLAIADPDSGPTIEDVDIYRHVLETDDMLVVVQYYLEYTTNPDEDINQAYLGRFMNGTTELVNVAPYAYYDKGYNHGVFSMYLGVADTPTWGGSYTVKFEGNPTLDWTGDPPSVTTTTLNWHATTTASATTLLLGSNIIAVANSLSDYWSVALTTATPSGTKLSSYGEQYFTNAIPNLRNMTPDIFPGAVEAPVYEEETFTQTYKETLSNRWSGTMAGNAFDNLASWTTMPLDVVKGLLWLVPTALVAYYTSVAAKDMRMAAFLALLMLPLGNLVGMLSLTFTVLGSLVCVVAIGYALFYQRG